jgi:hypothetical protein
MTSEELMTFTTITSNSFIITSTEELGSNSNDQHVHVASTKGDNYAETSARKVCVKSDVATSYSKKRLEKSEGLELANRSPMHPCTAGSQADIYESILFQNLTICINTYICDLSFSKTAFLKVSQNLRKVDAKT